MKAAHVAAARSVAKGFTAKAANVPAPLSKTTETAAQKAVFVSATPSHAAVASPAATEVALLKCSPVSAMAASASMTQNVAQG